MSVLILPNKAFSYLQHGIRKAAFNRTVDQFYSYKIHDHFENKNIDIESERLIKSWIKLNVDSFLERYPDEKPFQLHFKPSPIHKPLEPCQILKYVSCLLYNIEIEESEMSEQPRHDFKLLQGWEEDLKSAIIDSLEEYQAAAWCD